MVREPAVRYAYFRGKTDDEGNSGVLIFSGVSPDRQMRHWTFPGVGLFWLIALALTASSLQASHLLPIEKALLWEVSRSEKVLGYLFGTYHLPSDDKRFERPITLARTALAGVKMAAFELDLEEPGLHEAIGQAMVAPDGPNLDQLLGDELFAKASSLLEGHGIPRFAANFLKPWAVGIILSFPRSLEGQVMDQVLQDLARDTNIAIIGLESPEEQLDPYDDTSLHEQVEFAKIALQEPERIASINRQVADAYLDGDLEGLLKISLSGSTPAERASNERFLKRAIFSRNHRMANRLRVNYARGDLFVAVGALHLPGPQGLVNLLRGFGYDMRPIFF